jgi:hypothetical protein
MNGVTRVVIAARLFTTMSGSNERELGEYQGRRTVSDRDTTSVSEREVVTPRACMNSCARNSRTLERSTARPSAPRQ